MLRISISGCIVIIIFLFLLFPGKSAQHRQYLAQRIQGVINLFQCRKFAEAEPHGRLHLGAKPEEARSILPNSLKTEIVMTMNLREWRHFIRLRSANAAHPQMRQVSDLILKKFSEEYPLFFRDLAEKKGE